MRWIELFEGNGQRLSMSRLLVFLAFWPSCYVLLRSPTESMLGLFLGAFVLNYIGGKSADIFMGAEKLERADNSLNSTSNNTSSEPLARESKPARQGKSRAF